MIEYNIERRIIWIRIISLRFLFVAVDADGNDPQSHQDILTCGSCQKPFALSDIVCFIQHKIASCNKENFGQCFSNTDRERDNDDEALPLTTINTRRPSISAPISSKKSTGSRVHTPPPASPRLLAPADLCVDGAASSTPIRRGAATPLTTSSPEEGDDIKPIIKRERTEFSSSPEDHSQNKKSRTEVADAESNTTHSGKSQSNWMFTMIFMHPIVKSSSKGMNIEHCPVQPFPTPSA